MWQGYVDFRSLNTKNRTSYSIQLILAKIVANLACFVPLKVFVEYSLYLFFIICQMCVDFRVLHSKTVKKKPVKGF